MQFIQIMICVPLIMSE